MRTPQEIAQFKLVKSNKTVENEIKAPEEQTVRPANIIIRPLHKIKVKVETTEIFPLDLKCTLLFTDEDLKFYEETKRSQNENVEEPQEVNDSKIVFEV